MHKIEEGEHSSIRTSIRYHLRKFFDMQLDMSNESDLYLKTIHEAEKALIMETLSYTHHVQSKAAKLLGINRNTLRKKIKELNLKAPF